MKKLIGLAITAAVVLSPASPAFADRGDREDNRRSSSCTADLGVLTRTVNLQAFCGGERSAQRGEDSRRTSRRENARRSNRRSSSCTADLGVLTRSVSLQALCSGR